MASISIPKFAQVFTIFWIDILLRVHLYVVSVDYYFSYESAYIWDFWFLCFWWSDSRLIQEVRDSAP